MRETFQLEFILSKMLWEPSCMPSVSSCWFSIQSFTIDIWSAMIDPDKTRVISRARSSFFLLPFALLIMHRHIQTCCGIRIQSKATTTRELVAVWFPAFYYDVLLVVDRPFPMRALTKGEPREISSSRRTDRGTEDFDRNRCLQPRRRRRLYYTTSK